MNPLEVSPMVIPSAASTVAFVAVVLGVCAALLWAVRRSGATMGYEPSRVRQDMVRTALVLAGYLLLTAVVAESGVLATAAVPPPLMLMFVGTNLLAVGVAMSGFGKRLAHGLPVAALVGFQAFRFPLELILHDWYGQGTLPVQMTYAGANFDIASGVLGGLVGLWAWKGAPPRIVLWIYNLVGLALLITVASIAVLSSPLPIRHFMEEPAVLLALHAPYVWIIPFCVGGALLGHVVTFRHLLRPPLAEVATTCWPTDTVQP